jgi:hypothetical protein
VTRSRLREQLGMSARYLLLASAAIAAVARLIGADGAKEIDLAKFRPQHVRKVGLAMHALPEQEARQPDFATRSDDQIGIRQICPIEMTSDSLGRNALDHIGRRQPFCQLLLPPGTCTHKSTITRAPATGSQATSIGDSGSGA